MESLNLKIKEKKDYVTFKHYLDDIFKLNKKDFLK
jgi:hypothetical protein